MADEESLARTLNIQYQKLRNIFFWKTARGIWTRNPYVRRSAPKPLHYLNDIRTYNFVLPMTQFKDVEKKNLVKIYTIFSSVVT